MADIVGQSSYYSIQSRIAMVHSFLNVFFVGGAAPRYIFVGMATWRLTSHRNEAYYLPTSTVFHRTVFMTPRESCKARLCMVCLLSGLVPFFLHALGCHMFSSHTHGSADILIASVKPELARLFTPQSSVVSLVANFPYI